MVTRRNFLRSMFAALAGGSVAGPAVAGATAVPAPAAPPPAPEPVYRRVYLDEVYVAGFRFHEGMRPEVWGRLRAGDDLVLCPEPENPYDPDAIAVYDRQGAHLGYVPRRRNALPASLAEQGVALGAEISELDPEAEPWQRVRIRLYQRIAEIDPHAATRL